MSLVSACGSLLQVPGRVVAKTASTTGNAFSSIYHKMTGQDTAAAQQASATTTTGALDGTGNVSLASLQSAVSADTASISASVAALLQKAGISTTPAFALSSDGKGGITVDGDRSDIDIIQKILNADATLTQTFTRMSANASVLEAAQEAAAFQEAYRNDPTSAVQQYRYLFSGGERSPIAMLIDGTNSALLAGGQELALN